MNARRCTAQVYVRTAYRFRLDVQQCRNLTKNESGRCWQHQGRRTDVERVREDYGR